jgi:hypothetical protein
MADKTISALTGASTPLAGTEVLPIVQSGATVKVAVSDLTAGRAVSATAVTASTGNFIASTSGKGVTTGSSIPLGFGTNGGTAAMTVDTSGNLLVGTTTTAGIISNGAQLVGGVFKTLSGSVSAENNTATTLYTIGGGITAWLVTVNLSADAASLYSATYLINTQGGASTVATLIFKGTTILITMSGYAVQVTQTSGGTQTILYTAIRIA